MSKLKIITNVMDKVAGRVDDFTLDQTEKAELLKEINAAQMKINEIETGSTSLFKSGWRPFLGWVLCAAFGYHYIFQPFLLFIMASKGVVVELPEFDMNTMTTLLFGLLGMSGMRTWEKVKGRA
jgi:roadblock/LC7 domain-containing protein